MARGGRAEYVCPKCGGANLLVEAVFDCEIDGREWVCTKVDRDDMIHIDDLCYARCMKCGESDYLYRWETDAQELKGKV